MKIYNVIDVGNGGNNNVMYCTETKSLADIYCAYLNTIKIKYSMFEVKEAVLEDMRVSFLFFDDNTIEIASVHDHFDYANLIPCKRVSAITLEEAKQTLKDTDD